MALTDEINWFLITIFGSLGSIKSNNVLIKSSLSKMMSAVTIATMIAYTIVTVMGIVFHFKCNHIFAKLIPAFYQPAKCCMYLIFVMRLHHVYNQGNTKYSFNTLTLKITAVLLILIYGCLTVLGVLTVDHIVHTFDIWQYEGVEMCLLILGDRYLIPSLLTDIICTIASLIAFVSPLIRILNSLNEHYRNKQRTNDSIKYPAIKISILTLFATITSLFAHVISIISQSNTAFFYRYSNQLFVCYVDDELLSYAI
eukprot:736506_1